MAVCKKSKFFFMFIPVFLLCMVFLNFAITYSDEIPEWLKRVELSAEYESDKSPTFSFQMVQPLYQNDSKEDTFFIQPRASLYNERMTYNLGFGYRKLASDNLILGVNTFADYQERSHHGRAGVGFEALGQIFELRSNLYFGGITPKKNIEENSAGDLTIERVADGFDYELGVPLPYLPWLKVYGSGFWYDYENSSDKEGWKTRLEARVNQYTRLEFFTWDDNKGEQEYGGRIRLGFDFDSWKDVADAFKFSEEPFPEKDLTKELLIPVEREYDIIVEKYTEVGGLTIEAGRSG